MRCLKEERFYQPKYSYNAVSVHVWGFISGKGSSKLYFLDGKTRINSVVYAKILKFCQKEMNRLGVQYLMEDGAKCHSCRDSFNCKIRQDLGIKVFLKIKKRKWHSRIILLVWKIHPDLNPIENAWSSLKSAVQKNDKIDPTITSLLKRALRYYWKKKR